MVTITLTRLGPGGYPMAAIVLGPAATLNCAVGTYTITGSPAGLSMARVLDRAAGSYEITGAPAGLKTARILDYGLGTYTITGAPVAGLLQNLVL